MQRIHKQLRAGVVLVSGRWPVEESHGRGPA